MRRILLSCSLFTVCLTAGAQGLLQSPDGKTAVAVTAGTGSIQYAISRNGERLIAPSAIGLSFQQEDPLVLPKSSGMHHLQVLTTDARDGVDDYQPLAGKTSHVHDRYREETFHLQEADGLKRHVDLLVRAYDAGVAFRMRIPMQTGIRTVHLAGESTQFLFPENYACTGFNPGQPANSHEGEFDDVEAAHIRPHDLYDDPLVCRTSRGTSFAIVESDVEHYPAMYLSGLRDGRLGVQVHLPPLLSDSGSVKAEITESGFQTPWRVVMIADRPEKLLEANLIEDLAAPSRVADTNWIEPGLSTWDWWSGPNLPGVDHVGLNDGTYKRFIDLAEKMHLKYMLIDEGWAKNGKGDGNFRPDADVTQTNPDVNLPELVAYAKQRNVGLWLWLHWQSIDKQMDAALTLYEKLGVRGIKVDFMNRQDQDMVDFYHRLLSKAAEHHLMVDLHGAYPPRGLVRTYPNFMTEEGVMGAEYNKWSRRETAGHNVRLAYTRALLGPMDYTPGGWNNVLPGDFQPANIEPMVMTTRAQQLAMYVVYTSYFACVSDSPAMYTDAKGNLLPGLEVLKTMPVTWDETRAINGEFAKWIAVARRSGKNWYVGVMNDETAREVTLDLSFTNATKAIGYTDGNSPKDLRVGSLDANSSVHLKLAPGGGALLVFQSN